MKNRVLDSIKEYRTLLNTLQTSFQTNNTKQIEYLQKKEQELLNTFVNRVELYKKNYTKDNQLPEGINKELCTLQEEIDAFKNSLQNDKIKLGNEISNVTKRVRPLKNRYRDDTAGRIDITT